MACKFYEVFYPVIFIDFKPKFIYLFRRIIIMRILYLHQHFTTPKAGGGTRSYEFARKLTAHGHNVTMVCGGEQSTFNLLAYKKNIYRGDIDGIDVIQIALPYSNSDGLLKRTRVFLSYAWKATGIALREDYDLVFATSTPLT